MALLEVASLRMERGCHRLPGHFVWRAPPFSIPTMSRLAPIQTPRTLLQRFAYWLTRRQYGVVLTPMQVIYARKPRFAFLAQHIGSTFDGGLSLDDDLVVLATSRVAEVNGCAFCRDFNLAKALQKRLGMDRFAALAEYPTSPLFSDRERAALAFCEEAAREHEVSDARFEAVRAHFDATEIVELTWIAAAESYFNIQSGVLRLGSDGLAARAAEAQGSPVYAVIEAA